MDSMLICIIHNSKNNVKYLSNTKLAKIRKSCVAFKDGVTKIILAEMGLFVFSRGEGKDKIVVAVNASNHSKVIKLSKKCKDLYSLQIEKTFEIPSSNFVVLKGLNK